MLASFSTVTTSISAFPTFPGSETKVLLESFLIKLANKSSSSAPPSEGLASGGTSVTLTGTNFTDASSVMFGTTAAQNFTVDSDTQITAISPAGSAGATNITVTTAFGTTSPLSYTYYTVPAISSISPNEGDVAGGTEVVISGSNFSDVTEVRFGSTLASFVINSSSQITATTPTGVVGAVEVIVRNNFGESTWEFTYNLYVSPTIESFTGSSTSFAIDDKIAYTWDISNPSNSNLVCKLDFGIRNSKSLGTTTINPCPEQGVKYKIYSEAGSYISKLTVIDSLNNITSDETTVSLTSVETTIKNLSDPYIADLWTSIKAHPDVLDLELSFNDSDLYIEGHMDDLLFISTTNNLDEFMLSFIGDGNIISILLYNYSLIDDSLVVESIIEKRMVFIENISNYANATINSSSFDEIQQKVLPLLEAPVIEYAASQFDYQSNLLSLQANSSNAVGCRDCSDEYEDFETSIFNLELTAVGIAFSSAAMVACIPSLVGNAFAAVTCASGAIGTAISFAGFIIGMKAVVDSQNSVLGCIRGQLGNLYSGNGVIASGYRTLATAEVRDTVVNTRVYAIAAPFAVTLTDTEWDRILFDATDNAIATFNSLTGHSVIENALYRHPRRREIRATWTVNGFVFPNCSGSP